MQRLERDKVNAKARKRYGQRYGVSRAACKESTCCLHRLPAAACSLSRSLSLSLYLSLARSLCLPPSPPSPCRLEADWKLLERVNLTSMPVRLTSPLCPYAYQTFAREGKSKGHTGEVCERGHPDNKTQVIGI
jgi:hypothetical protein